MRIGAHVSIAGGIARAPGRAREIGCEVFQVFTRSPRGGFAPALTPEVARRFLAEMRRHGYDEFVVHAPYYVNLASPSSGIRTGSVSILRDELERGTRLGARYVVTHLGSSGRSAPRPAHGRACRAVQRILASYQGSCALLLELSAGAQGVLGGSFDQLAALIASVESDRRLEGKLGVCLDTCHAFAAGYDLRTEAAVEATLQALDATLGLARLKLIHGNDSKYGLGERKDRHEHVGRGAIGAQGFRALVNRPELRTLAMIVETPWDDRLKEDVSTLKRLRRGRAQE